MKVAVCFSGLPRGPFLDILETYKKIFDGYDFFYSTWNGQNLPLMHMSFPEPNSDYLKRNKGKMQHLKTGETSIYSGLYKLRKEYTLEALSQNHHMQHLYERHTRGYKQILAHALQLKYQIPMTYDMIIRCRYDVRPTKNWDWKNMVMKSYQQSTVYAYNGRSPAYENENWETSEETPVLKDRHSHALYDHMIMHPRRHFNSEFVLSLYENEYLKGIEEGWYQVFSNATTDIRWFRGGLLLHRNVLEDEKISYK